MNLHKLVGPLRDLADKYPTALADVECYAQCGPGWMSAVIPVLDVCEAQGVAVQQIKQKFGGLRIYTDRADPAVDAAIRQAEDVCWKTCEECGEAGRLRAGGYVRTLCDGCAS